MAEGSFMVGPSSLSISLQKGSPATASVYVTSDFDGELVVGTQGLPFAVKPARIEVSSADENREILLTLQANGPLEETHYAGAITFLAYSGDNIGYGIRVKTDIIVESVPQTKSNLSIKIIIPLVLAGSAVLIFLALLGFRKIKRRKH